jgi:hypothetical protein
MEKTGSLSSQSSTESSHREVLTGPSPAKNVNWFGFGGSDILVPLHLGPVLAEDLYAGSVNLALPSGLNPSSLRSEIKSTDSSE